MERKWDCPVHVRQLVWALVACSLTAARPAAHAADRLVLRNLDIVTGRSVTGFDEDGVRLDDDSVLAWDRIESGRVAADRQPAFDQMLQTLGTPLYRIRQRLTVGDYREILPHAEALYPRYARRTSATAYMVFQGLMWARLATGRREAAVEPYLRCYDYLRSIPASKVSLPGARRLRFDPQTGMTPELVPVWFDAPAAKAALPGVYRTVTEMNMPRPAAARVYYGTLALTAGQQELAQQVLVGIPDQPAVLAQLRQVTMAQAEVLRGRPGPAVARLEANLQSLVPENRPLGIYWVGMSKLRAGDPTIQRSGILQLLRLPAVYGNRCAELSGAALYASMNALAESGDPKGRDALRGELLQQYSQTYHAAKVRAELGAKGNGS